MHPSKDIVGSKGDELRGRKIVVGVTGSVAAIRAVDLVRELMRHGAEVRVVMSKHGAELVTPQLFHWASGNEVVVSLTGRIEHVELAQWADAVVVAPATSNTIGKIAHAIDDTPVTSVVSVALGLRKPVVVVPAMHLSMYQHPLLKENLQKLRTAGVEVIEPVVEGDRAKFPSVELVVERMIALLGPRDMEGLKVIITAGPTVEPIDPIKRITNPSSGKMGIAFARVAAARGAEVCLIYGPGTETPPLGVRVVRVTTTQEMKEAFDRELESKPHIVISAAAPQDFVVESPSPTKLRHGQEVVLKLKPAPRIIDRVRERLPQACLIGFKAEHMVSDEELERAGKEKLTRDELDIVVANDVARPGAGFGTDTNQVVVVTKNASQKMVGTKDQIAKKVLDLALELLKEKR